MQRVTGVLTKFPPSELAGLTKVRDRRIGFAEKSWPTCARAPVVVSGEELPQVKRAIPIGPCVKRAVKLTISGDPPEGGTIVPAPGTISVAAGSPVLLNAAPNPGYRFTGWSPNVADPASIARAAGPSRNRT